MRGVIPGYVGRSMSVGACEAYRDGEMPKSKWTKAAMVEAIKACCDANDLAYAAVVERLSKVEMFDRFFYRSSWHHTGKFFNETDFYSVDEEAVAGTFRPMTGEELAARAANARQACETHETARAAEAYRTFVRNQAMREYHARHGFPANSVAAFMEAHPERCRERVAKTSGNLLVCFEHCGSRYEVPVKDVRHRTVLYFNAVDEPKRLSLKDVCDQQRGASERLSERGDHGPSGRDEQVK